MPSTPESIEAPGAASADSRAAVLPGPGARRVLPLHLHHQRGPAALPFAYDPTKAIFPVASPWWRGRPSTSRSSRPSSTSPGPSWRSSLPVRRACFRRDRAGDPEAARRGRGRPEAGRPPTTDAEKAERPPLGHRCVRQLPTWEPPTPASWSTRSRRWRKPRGSSEAGTTRSWASLRWPGGWGVRSGSRCPPSPQLPSSPGLRRPYPRLHVLGPRCSAVSPGGSEEGLRAPDEFESPPLDLSPPLATGKKALRLPFATPGDSLLR